MLQSSVSSLNSAAFGVLPKVVYERLTELRAKLAAQPSHFMLKEVPRLLWDARKTLAEYLGAEPHHLLFTTNTSAALNLIVSSLSIDNGGEILTSEYEYQTARWCWERFAAKNGASINTFPFDLKMTDEEVVESFVSSITEETKILFLSHVLSASGRVLPIQKICELATASGITTVIDGAQAAGNIALRLSDIECDFYIGCGHKWLLMPSGSGFLYIGRHNENRLKPLVVSWGANPEIPIDDERDQFGSTSRLRLLECEGTRDICPWLVAPEALKLQSTIGLSQVRERVEALATYCRKRLNTLDGLSLLSFPDEVTHSGIVAFYIAPDIDGEKLKVLLWQHYNLDVGVFKFGNDEGLRISCHFYNVEDEIDGLAEGISELVSKCVKH